MRSLYSVMFGKKKAVIIPVASGKGGVGKSIFSANLAVALAQMGKETCAVDLDFGGANLHNYLGMSNKYAGIGDYLKAGNADFKTLMVKTHVPNLSMVPGDGKTPFMANVPFEQRERLLNAVRDIKGDYTILDLAAGSTFNTLNFFGLAHKAVMITTFETPAVMNFLMFLKYFVFRIVSSMVRHDDHVFTIVKNAFRQASGGSPLTTDGLIRIIGREDRHLAEKSATAVAHYRPRIIFNMGEGPEDLNVIRKVERTIRNSLSLEADYLGFIFFDANLRQAVKTEKSLMTEYPDLPFCRDVKDIAAKIITGWEKPMPGSIEALYEETKTKKNRRS